MRPDRIKVLRNIEEGEIIEDESDGSPDVHRDGNCGLESFLIEADRKVLGNSAQFDPNNRNNESASKLSSTKQPSAKEPSTPWLPLQQYPQNRSFPIQPSYNQNSHDQPEEPTRLDHAGQGRRLTTIVPARHKFTATSGTSRILHNDYLCSRCMAPGKENSPILVLEIKC